MCATCRRSRAQHTGKDARLQRDYGITYDEYLEILRAQGGGCAICGRTPRYLLDVDHDHAIERALVEMGRSPLAARRMSIRGLLDKPCNRRLLPAARDDVNVLDRAIAYLEEWPATEVLGVPQLVS